MLPDWTVVGFTGHRKIADPTAVGGGISAALNGLATTHPSMLAISSLATGSDTLFVRDVARRGVPFLLIFPFPGGRFREDFTPEEWLAAAPLMEQAAYIEEVRGSESDEEAYMEAGVRTVDQADVVLAVWDGHPPAGLGGTGDVVAYARELNKPLLLLDPATGAVVKERIDQLRDIGTPTDWSGAPRQTVERHYRELDEAATREAPHVRHLIQRIVVLHLTASVLGLTALALHIGGLAGYGVALLEIVLLGTAFALTARRRHAHVEWMKARIEAELCRSFLATWPMRARMGSPPRLAIQGFERLARNLRLLQQMDRSPSPSLEVACREYLEGRVRHQIDYFSRQCGKAQHSYRRLTRLAMLSTALAALLAAGHLVLSIIHVEGPALATTELLSLVLPLVSAALLSLVLTQEHSRRASRYREMVSLLEEAARRLSAARTWAGLTRVVTETEEALLNEVVEWHTFRRFASEPH